MSSHEITREDEAWVLEVVITAKAKETVTLKTGTAAEVGTTVLVVYMEVVVNEAAEAVNNPNTSNSNHTNPSIRHGSTLGSRNNNFFFFNSNSSSGIRSSGNRTQSFVRDAAYPLYRLNSCSSQCPSPGFIHEQSGATNELLFIHQGASLNARERTPTFAVAASSHSARTILITQRFRSRRASTDCVAIAHFALPDEFRVCIKDELIEHVTLLSAYLYNAFVVQNDDSTRDIWAAESGSSCDMKHDNTDMYDISLTPASREAMTIDNKRRLKVEYIDTTIDVVFHVYTYRGLD